MNPEELENLIAERFSQLPRKHIEAGRKDLVWSKIQNHLRQQRQIPVQHGTLFWFLHSTWGKAAVTTLSVILAVSVVRSAANATPDETLYQVKKAAEQVEKVLATNEEAKVKVGVKHAKRRLEEVQILVAEKKDDRFVTQTIAALQNTTKQIVAATETNPELLGHAVELAAEEEKVLTDVHTLVEGVVKTAIADALSRTKESITKLAGQETQEDVKGEDTEATSTPAIVRPAKKSKTFDAPVESPIQLHDFQPVKSDDESKPETTEPTILDEPTLDF